MCQTIALIMWLITWLIMWLIMWLIYESAPDTLRLCATASSTCLINYLLLFLCLCTSQQTWYKHSPIKVGTFVTVGTESLHVHLFRSKTYFLDCMTQMAQLFVLSKKKKKKIWSWEISVCLNQRYFGNQLEIECPFFQWWHNRCNKDLPLWNTQCISKGSVHQSSDGSHWFSVCCLGKWNIW